ncbi:hypothetical protein VTK73DRAFT_941 [Phialemonium thermophilum]|uniref:Uncharacterized protein n=1 Tax=Phialemonium thermophilum TaxID=223376 RepID=A0ABR3VU47_9PEZI
MVSGLLLGAHERNLAMLRDPPIQDPSREREFVVPGRDGGGKKDRRGKPRTTMTRGSATWDGLGQKTTFIIYHILFHALFRRGVNSSREVDSPTSVHLRSLMEVSAPSSFRRLPLLIFGEEEEEKRESNYARPKWFEQFHATRPDISVATQERGRTENAGSRKRNEMREKNGQGKRKETGQSSSLSGQINHAAPLFTGSNDSLASLIRNQAAGANHAARVAGRAVHEEILHSARRYCNQRHCSL